MFELRVTNLYVSSFVCGQRSYISSERQRQKAKCKYFVNCDKLCQSRKNVSEFHSLREGMLETGHNYWDSHTPSVDAPTAERSCYFTCTSDFPCPKHYHFSSNVPFAETVRKTQPHQYLRPPWTSKCTENNLENTHIKRLGQKGFLQIFGCGPAANKPSGKMGKASSFTLVSSSVRALGSQAWWVCGNILWLASGCKGFCSQLQCSSCEAVLLMCCYSWVWTTSTLGY